MIHVPLQLLALADPSAGHASFMNAPLVQGNFFTHDIIVTPWKLIGYLGTFIFASRWFVQLYFSRKYGRVTMPTAFWIMSVVGSALLLSYFIFGKNDSVGVLSNLFPAFVSAYNLFLDLKHAKRRTD
jgi:lipid-A-disaccharide synthase-like uncharacterized protein